MCVVVVVDVGVGGWGDDHVGGVVEVVGVVGVEVGGVGGVGTGGGVDEGAGG